jgi:hypothetical protein
VAGKVETKHEMLRAGYKFLSNAKCKSCKAAIEWWLTNNGKKIPFNPMPASDHETATPHWATCPKADEHRAPKQAAAADAELSTCPYCLLQIEDCVWKGKHEATATPKPSSLKPTGQELEKLVAVLRDKVNAKIVVAIMDDGSAASWRKDISGEDLRQDLITEGNSIRRHIEGSQPR